MAPRRVLLQLPDEPSKDVLELAHAIRVTLTPHYYVTIRSDSEFDDDITPVDIAVGPKLLVLSLRETR